MIWRLKTLFARRTTRTPSISDQKFWASTPRHRNAFELFDGRWASNLTEIDPSMPNIGTPLFAMDSRPRSAATALGHDNRFDGMSVMELGPLEGAHSHQLEQLGVASNIAIESNADSFLRCLVIKNALALNRTTFLLGDCVAYLAETETRFDLIFACGILYHMADPFELIRLMALRSDKVFIWTAYYSAEFRFKSGKPLPNRPFTYARDGLSVEAYEKIYDNPLRGDFWGGVAPRATWLRLDDIVAALRHYGFAHVEVIETNDGVTGPTASLAARKVP